MDSNDMNHKLYLKSTWRHGTLTLAEFAEQTIGLLKDLRRLHPAFSRLNMSDVAQRRYLPVSESLSGFGEPLMQCAWDRLAAYAFEPMNSVDESPLPESTSVQGYRITFYSAPPDDRYPRAVEVYVRAGIESRGASNVCTLVFGYIEPFTSTGFQRELLATVMAHWPVDSSTLDTLSFGEAVCGNAPDLYKLDRPAPLNIGWLTYVRKAGIGEALPPGTKVEPFGETPGVLITLDGDRFEPDNPKQIAQALEIREALRAANQLGNPAETPGTEIDSKTIRPLRKNRRKD